MQDDKDRILKIPVGPGHKAVFFRYFLEDPCFCYSCILFSNP